MDEFASRVIPAPKSSIDYGEKLSVKPIVSCECAEWAPLIEGFAESLKILFDLAMADGDGTIRIVLDKEVAPEAYILEIDQEIKISASSYHGCAYALATVIQLAELDEGELTFHRGKIADQPDRDYRCFMVDIARQWHPFKTLQHYIDLCFFYKVKYLHLHFTDDQSYTLPSKAFPKLPTPNRSYSFAQIAELRRYAKSRGIILVPELEAPGHAKALNAAYPEIFSDSIATEQDVGITTETGASISHDSIICAGSEAAYSAVIQLIDEVLALFPESPYIHLGGDEANIAVWDKCTVCRSYMQRHGLKDAKELYGEFTGRVTDYVLSKGRTPIVWEGFSKQHSDKISKDTIVIAWESYYNYPDDLLNDGYRIINASWQPLYIVPSVIRRWGIKEILDWNMFEWQHWWEKSAACLNPFHVKPSEQVIGAQLCAWEQTYESEIAAVVENLSAFSERVWSVKRVSSFEQFLQKYAVQAVKAFKLIQEV